ncbi:MAG: nucleotide exchange factor GrpE [Vampirovibrionales bacterium]|nr:nucleotide exchange factor GrpE [Vampirovibrionales bacterium]
MNPFQKAASAAPGEDAVEESSAAAPTPESPAASDAEDWKAQYDGLYDQHLRLAADFDNFRKRVTQEREALMKFGAESTLQRLIPVLDTLDRGLGSLTEQSDSKTLFQGMTLMRRQLLDALTQLGLTRIETVGQAFDPNFHEAAGQTPTDAVPENQILLEAMSGYMLHDRVLRPALVMVAAPPVSSAPSEPPAPAAGNPFTPPPSADA